MWFWIFTGLAGAIFLGLSWLLWLNRGSQAAIPTLIKTLLGPMFVGGLLFLTEIFSPLPIEADTTQILVLRNGHQLAPLLMGATTLYGPPYRLGYVKLNLALHGWRKQILEKSKEASNAIDDEFMLSLLELTFWEWLCEKYNLHWFVDRASSHGISSSGGSAWQSLNAEKHPYTCSPEEIRRHLSRNPLLSQNAALGAVKFPSRSKIFVARTNGKRTIRVFTQQMTLIIEMKLVGQERLGGTDLAEKLKAELPDPNSWLADIIHVVFTRRYKPLLRWSPKTLQQKEWASEMVKLFRDDFDWALVRPDLEKFLERKKAASTSPQEVTPEGTVPTREEKSGPG